MAKWVEENYDLSIHLEQNVLFQKVFQKYGTDVLIVNTKDKAIRKLQNIIANAKSDLAFRIPKEIPKTIDELNHELGLKSNPYNPYQKQTNYVILKDDFLKFIEDLDKKLTFEIKVDIQFNGQNWIIQRNVKFRFPHHKIQERFIIVKVTLKRLKCLHKLIQNFLKKNC